MPYLKDSEYSKRPKTDFLVVHCSATKATQDIGVEQIRQWHIKERGWKDVGYHYVIRRDGTREPGRPTWAQGAHVEGHNNDSLGICLVGGVNEQGAAEKNFTDAQMATLEDTLRLLITYSWRDAQVVGHHDIEIVNQKACPSFDAKAWWAPIGAKLLKDLASAR